MQEREELINALRQYPWLGGVLAIAALAAVYSFARIGGYWRATAALGAWQMWGHAPALKIPASEGILFFITLFLLLFLPGGTSYFFPTAMLGVIFLSHKHGGKLQKFWAARKYAPLGLAITATGLALAALTALVPVSMLVERVANAMGWDMTTQDSVKMLKDSAGWDRAWILFAVIFLAPAAEELLFRGLLHSWLRASCSVAGATILSAALFSAVHMHPFTAMQLFLLGIYLALIYEHTGSLALCVGVHTAFNALNVLYVIGIDYLS